MIALIQRAERHLNLPLSKIFVINGIRVYRVGYFSFSKEAAELSASRNCFSEMKVNHFGHRHCSRLNSFGELHEVSNGYRLQDPPSAFFHKPSDDSFGALLVAYINLKKIWWDPTRVVLMGSVNQHSCESQRPRSRIASGIFWPVVNNDRDVSEHGRAPFVRYRSTMKGEKPGSDG